MLIHVLCAVNFKSSREHESKSNIQSGIIMAIQQSALLHKAAYYTLTKEATESHNFNKKRKAFLCHSHKDEKLVKGLLVILEEYGIDLYIDWKDNSMPETPNGETARKIQEKIRESDVFLFLATSYSKASRWCPWEIGFADSCKKGIYIIPTDDGNATYGNEYLQLYARIDSGWQLNSLTQSYSIFTPNSPNGYKISNTTII